MTKIEDKLEYMLENIDMVRFSLQHHNLLEYENSDEARYDDMSTYHSVKMRRQVLRDILTVFAEMSLKMRYTD
jgi:hypothetical protein